jgi:LuxR family maltose regulon positive regulatory protein
MTSLSEHKKSGNVSIRMLDEPSRFDYSFSRHRFIPSEPVVLSERGKQVFDLIVQNCPNVEIASRLDISYNTVKFHKKNIYSKTGIKNSMEAIRYAMVNQMPLY